MPPSSLAVLDLDWRTKVERPVWFSRSTPPTQPPAQSLPPSFLVLLLSRFTLSSARRPLSLKRHSMRLAFGYCVGHCRDIELDDPYDVNGPVKKRWTENTRERGERKIAAMKRAAQNARERGIGHISTRFVIHASIAITKSVNVMYTVSFFLRARTLSSRY